MRKVSRWSVGALCVWSVVSVSAQSQTPAPTSPVRREIMWPAAAAQEWQSVRGLLTRMADKMPAEYYSFKPTPDMRTFAANVAHIASGNLSTCAGLLKKKHPLLGQKIETTLTQKAEVVAALKASADMCDEYFAQLTASAQLSDAFIESSSERAGIRYEFKVAHGVIVSSLFSHSNELYGYMAVYLRLKGIVPPSSERPAAAPPRRRPHQQPPSPSSRTPLRRWVERRR